MLDKFYIFNEDFLLVQVWAICQMLHRDGTEHFHNQAVVCCSLLTLSPHAIEIAKALVFATLNNILATELKTKPLDSISNTSIFALLKYYEPINELSCYVLYIVIMLVDFCLVRAYVEDSLNLVMRSYMSFYSVEFWVLTAVAMNSSVVMDAMLSSPVSQPTFHPLTFTGLHNIISLKMDFLFNQCRHLIHLILILLLDICTMWK